jgi:type II secretory pathway pseudopilin PulG
MGGLGMMRQENNAGFTIVELIAGLFISSFVMVGVIKSFALITTTGNDQRIRIITRLQAEATLYSVGSEIRAMGNGVPFDQANFQIGESTLSDPTLTYPLVVATSDADSITFRVNESGRTYILTDDYEASAGAVIELTDVEGLDVGEKIYITNSVVGEDDGLYGVINNVNTVQKKITLSTRDYSPDATFKKGSLLEQVSNVTYEKLVDDVFRDNEANSVAMAPNSTISFRYLNSAGTEISPPLTESHLVNDVRNIEVTVSVTSDSNLSSGVPHVTTVSQIFSLRNLNYVL